MQESIRQYLEESFRERRLLRETNRGSVWLASDKTGRPVIVKMIKATGLPYRKLKELSHPLWPAIRFVAEEADATWIVEEYVSGQNLREYLEDGQHLTGDEARDILLQMAEGLGILHQAGILHRDIKPSNLIWQGRQVFLIDFDAAREMRPGKESDTHVLGTAGYAPPEQYGFAPTDGRSDLYALGKTLDELLDPSVKGGLRDTLRRMTAFDPEKRYPSASALRRAVLLARWKPWLLGAAMLLLFIGGLLYPFTSQPIETPIPAEEEPVSRETAPSAQVSPPPLLPVNPGPDSKPDDGVAGSLPEEPSANRESAPAPTSKILPQQSLSAHLFFNGEPNDGQTVAVPSSEWITWTELHRANYYQRTMSLPKDWMFHLVIENHGPEPIQRPCLVLRWNQGEPRTFYAAVSTLPPGETTTIEIPLGGLPVESRSWNLAQIDLQTEGPENAPDGIRTHWEPHIHLASPPPPQNP